MAGSLASQETPLALQKRAMRHQNQPTVVILVQVHIERMHAVLFGGYIQLREVMYLLLKRNNVKDLAVFDQDPLLIVQLLLK